MPGTARLSDKLKARWISWTANQGGSCLRRGRPCLITTATFAVARLTHKDSLPCRPDRLRIIVGVLGSQPFRLGSRQQIVVCGDEGQGR